METDWTEPGLERGKEKDPGSTLGRTEAEKPRGSQVGWDLQHQQDEKKM